MIKYLPLLAISLAVAGLGIGYALGGHSAWVLPIMLAGLVWLAGHWRRWPWSASFGLILFVTLAAWGVFLELPAGWLLLAVITTLAAWDLAYFSWRLEQVPSTADPAGLLRAHLSRLALATGLGLILGGLALQLHFELSLGWALLLGLLILLGLSRAVRTIRRRQ